MKIKVYTASQYCDLLKKSYSKLNQNLGERKFEFLPVDGFTSHINAIETDETCTIHLMPFSMTAFLYSELSKQTDSNTISTLDNGSTSSLDLFLIDKQLKIRLLGVQKHCRVNALNEIKEENVIRLKDMRARPDLSEIVWRTTDIAIININSIRRSDQIGNLSSQTTGLTIEEACLNAKYIGASDLIKTIYITGFELKNDPYGMIESNIANLLWYIDEGLNMRNIELPLESEENLHFSIVPEDYDLELEFVKSGESGRWWVKVQSEEDDIYLPCTQNDYDQACQNIITDRVLKAVEIA